ncbi:GNAT family N-acetyltransferase [Rhodophyticola sp.]|jgi:GNAT superfamily N-acetyltransferase|uniref:GNAT family N-acetyltransferase n=1 Tax=Rhodophyticola sp. TaxID=2680032 RepID=UPI003D2B34A7
MTLIPAGTEVSFITTYLEMRTRPDFDVPALPDDTRLEQALRSPVWFFLAVYDAVGRDYEWRDRFQQEIDDPDALRAFVESPDVEMWVAYRHGWPQGFFILDWTEPGECDLAYFGMVPEAVGHGLGGILLKAAIARAWAREDMKMMSVNTCELDHPRALALYQKHGFVPVDTETRTRVLHRDRDPSRLPA